MGNTTSKTETAMPRQVALSNPRHGLLNRQSKMPTIAAGPRYNEETYPDLTPTNEWHTVADEGLPLMSGGENKTYTAEQGQTAIMILALLNPEPKPYDLRRFGLNGRSSAIQNAISQYSGADERNYMRATTNSEVELNDFFKIMEDKAIEFVRLKAPPAGVPESRAECTARATESRDIYSSLRADYDAFTDYMDVKIDKLESSLRPVHCSRGDVPKGLLSQLRKREQARFEQLKDEADEILRLADESTSIPDSFVPMKLYSFMSISEQDAFWSRRYNDHKWEWLQHLHRRVPLPELFQLLDHQLQFQFIQVCKSYENSVNSKNASSKWLMAVPEAKHTKAAALVKAREDFAPNYARHSRVFKDSVTDYLQQPDAIPRESLADEIPIFKGIMSSNSGKASPRKGAWLPGNLQVNRVRFRTTTV